MLTFDTAVNEVCAEMDFKVSEHQARILLLASNLLSLAGVIDKPPRGLTPQESDSMIASMLAIATGLLDALSREDPRDAVIQSAMCVATDVSRRYLQVFADERSRKG